jgi:hypothetical protein
MHRTYALAQIFFLAKQAFFMAKPSNISQSCQHCKFTPVTGREQQPIV